MSADRKVSVVSTEHRRKSVAEEPVTSVLAPGEVAIFDRELNSDEEVLAALGYKYVPSVGGIEAKVLIFFPRQARVQA